jgi:hypothetical protein
MAHGMTRRLSLASRQRPTLQLSNLRNQYIRLIQRNSRQTLIHCNSNQPKTTQ